MPTTSGEIIKEILIRAEPKLTSAHRHICKQLSISPSMEVLLAARRAYSFLPYIEMGDSTINIPQLEVKQRDFTYKAIKDTDNNSTLYGYVFPDGSSVTLKEDENNEFLLFLQESNASSDSKNFSIEIYEVEEQSGNEFLTPLGFGKRPQRDMIVDGFMMDNDRQGESETTHLKIPRFEYYFEIEVDEEIDPTILTKAMQSGRFADIRDLESSNTMTFNGEDLELARLGNSATDIYGPSFSEIASMTEAALDAGKQGRDK